MMTNQTPDTQPCLATHLSLMEALSQNTHAGALTRRILGRLTPRERHLPVEEVRDNASQIIKRIFPELRYTTRASYKGVFVSLLDRAVESPKTLSQHLEPLRSRVRETQSAARGTALDAVICRMQPSDLHAGSGDLRELLTSKEKLMDILARGPRLTLGTRNAYAYAARQAAQQALGVQQAQQALGVQQAQAPAMATAVPETTSWREFPLSRNARSSILFKLPEGGIRTSDVASFLAALLPLASDYDPSATKVLESAPNT